MYSLTYFLLVYSRGTLRFAIVSILCSAIIANNNDDFFWSRELEGPHQCICSRYCSAFSLELSDMQNNVLITFWRTFVSFLCASCATELCVYACVCLYACLFSLACVAVVSNSSSYSSDRILDRQIMFRVNSTQPTVLV